MTLKDLSAYLEEEFNKHRILITTSGTALGRWLHRNGIAGPRFFLSVCVLSLGTAGYYLFCKKKKPAAIFCCFMALSCFLMGLADQHDGPTGLMECSLAAVLFLAGIFASVLYSMKYIDNEEERKTHKWGLLFICWLIGIFILFCAVLAGITYLSIKIFA